jgi:hypothetical protein
LLVASKGDMRAIVGASDASDNGKVGGNMPFDLTTFTEGIATLKTAIGAVRSAYSITKDIRSSGHSTESEQKAIENALRVASSNTAIAEATLAQAFGYEMCRCQFPPTPYGNGWVLRPSPP